MRFVVLQVAEESGLLLLLLFFFVFVDFIPVFFFYGGTLEVLTVTRLPASRAGEALLKSFWVFFPGFPRNALTASGCHT